MQRNKRAVSSKRFTREKKSELSMRKKWPTKKKIVSTLRKSTNATWTRIVNIKSRCVKISRESSMKLTTMTLRHLSMLEETLMSLLVSMTMMIIMTVLSSTILMLVSATNRDANVKIQVKTRPQKSSPPH